MDYLQQDLEDLFKGGLPGVVAHDLVMSYERPSVQEILKSDKNPRRSAVVFLLYPLKGVWNFLLLKRHDYKGVHSGQVGLPGGSLDEGETAIEAAVRELHEESGLAIAETDIIASLTSLYIPPSNFIVEPFVAIAATNPIWRFDTREVKRGIEVPLRHLLLKDSLKDKSVRMSGGKSRLKVRAFEFENEVVWGATAMILSECKEILRTLAI